MNRYLKYGLIAAAGTILLIAGGIAYIATTFNPNDYKPQVIQAVKERMHRTLRLDGDIRLTFYPGIGAELGQLSLSELDSDKEFVSVESAHVSLALFPLLSRQVVVDKIAIKGLRATLVKFKDGKTNFDNLAGGEDAAREQEAPSSQPVAFDIAAIHIENTELLYRDESSGAQYTVKNLNLHTGRIANGIPSAIDFSASLQANQPELDLSTKMQASLMLDLEQQTFHIAGLDLQVEGRAMDIRDLAVQASGEASANPGAQEFTADKLLVTVSGIKGNDRFDAKLDIPELNLTKDRYASGRISLDAMLKGALGDISASISLPGLEGTAQSFQSSALTLSVDVKQPDQTIKLKLSSPLQGSLDAQQLNLPGLVLAASASGDNLPGKSVSSEMKGSIKVDAVKQQVQASLSGGLLQSQVAAKLAVNGFSPASVRFNLNIDQLDTDLYLPKSASSEPPAQPAAVTPETPLDLAALKTLDLEGNVRIGSLKASGVKLSQLKLGMKATDGILDIGTLSANLYGGSFSGSASVNAQQTTPAFSATASVNGIDIGALFMDAAELDTIDGRANLSFDLITHGNTPGALQKGASGSAKFDFSKLVIRQAGATYTGELKGSAQLDGNRQAVQVSLAGNADQSRFTAKLGLHDFSDPAIRFDVEVDQFDADQYMPKQQPAESNKSPAAPEQSFDLSALNRLNAEGRLRIGSLRMLNLKLAQIRLDMQAHKGIISISPLAVSLYQGSFSGKLGLDARSLPAFTIVGKLDNVSVAPLSKDLLDLDMLEGKGNVTFSLATRGDTVSALKKSLGGEAKLELAEGAIRGIDLARLIENASALGKGTTTQTLGITKADKTDFSEFQASFKVDKGIAHNGDLSVKSPSLHISGKGDIDIGNSRIDYTAKATLKKRQDDPGLMVPLQINGPFSDLKFKLDYATMLEELARQKLQAKTEEVKNKAVEDAKKKLQEGLQRGLKGLFK